MTHDEIIRIADKAFATSEIEPAYRNGYYFVTVDELKRFAELVAAAAKAEERASCAAVCDGTLAKHYMQQTIPSRDEALLLSACADCAQAIRARGNT